MSSGMNEVNRKKGKKAEKVYNVFLDCGLAPSNFTPEYSDDNEPRFPVNARALLQEAGELLDTKRSEYLPFPTECRKLAEAEGAIIEGSTWTAAHRHPIRMALMKLVRESSFHKEDNILDAICYLALYLEMRRGE